MTATNKKQFIMGTACMVLSVTIFISVSGAQIESPAADGETESIISSESVAYRAANMVFYETISDHGVTVADIKELSRRSTDIIAGRALAARSIFRKGSGQDDVHIKHLILVQAASENL